MLGGQTPPGLKLDIFQHLLRINADYDQVICSLAALRKHGVFHSDELARVSASSKEARAATNSYRLSAMEIAETNEADRRFSKRLAKDRTNRGIDIVMFRVSKRRET
jgi:hypothetical protein